MCREISNSNKAVYIGLFNSEVKSERDRRFVENICNDIASRLEDSKKAWPAYCNSFADPASGQRLYSEATWDQRRCFSDIIVSDFEEQLKNFATARNSKLHRDGQKYREIEVRYFLMATRPQCYHHKDLYQLYSCVETNGRKLISKFGQLKARWNELKSNPVSLKEMCHSMDSLLLTKAELRFIATRMQGQQKIEGYPAYQECRSQNMLPILTACGTNRDLKLSEKQWDCLKGAIHGLAEDIDKFDRYGSEGTGYHYLLSNLHQLKYKAARVSTMSHMCINRLQPNSLLVETVMDEQTNYYCQSNKIKKLLGLKIKDEEDKKEVACERNGEIPVDQDLLDLSVSMTAIEENLIQNGGETKTYEQYQDELRVNINDYMLAISKSRSPEI